MAKCVGEVDMDVAEEFSVNDWYIRVRCRNLWRLVMAMRVLRLALLVARLLGVGVRLVPQGQLVVPHYKLTKLVREYREDTHQAEEAQRIGVNNHD